MCIRDRASDATAFTLPSSVYTVDEIQKAVTKAKERHKLVFFVTTYPKSTCPYTASGTLQTIEEFDNKCVVIFVDPEEGHDKVSLPILESLGLVKKGKKDWLYPRGVILQPDLETVVVTLPYASGKEREQLWRDAKKKITEALKQSESGSAPAASKNTTGKMGVVVSP